MLEREKEKERGQGIVREKDQEREKEKGLGQVQGRERGRGTEQEQGLEREIGKVERIVGETDEKQGEKKVVRVRAVRKGLQLNHSNQKLDVTFSSKQSLIKLSIG